MGIDPSTHKPKTNPLGSGQQKDTAYLSHMAQWESARLEAESRLVRESRLFMSTPIPTTTPTLCPATLSVQSLNKTSRIPPPFEPMAPPCLHVLKAWQGTWKSAANGFFNPNGTLQSPTSTLHFSDNINFPNSSTGCFGDNLAFPAISAYVENPKPMGGGITKETNQLNDDDELVGNYPIVAAYFEDSLRPPSFMEGFTEADGGQNSYSVPLGSFHHVDSLDGSSGGDLEDNKKYWNSIVVLNVENPTSESNLLLSNL